MNETTTPTDRSVTRRRRILIIAAAGALVLLLTAGALTAYGVNQSAAAAAEQERAAAAAAAEEARLLDLYTTGYGASSEQAAVVTADATAIAATGSALLTSDDLVALAALAETLTAELGAGLPAGADSEDARDAFLDLDAATMAGRAALAEVVGNIGAAAQAAHDAYTLADPATLTALVEAKSAFAGAAANRVPAADAFISLTAAVSAAGASHQAAAELAAAAAAAAASGKKTYTHNGQTYYSGTITPAVPGTTSPPAPGNPGSPSEPVKAASTKASELAAKYGGSTSVAGACVALNYGHVTGTSSFGPSATYDGYYSAVSVTSEANASYVNYYAVQWYACPN